MPTKTESLRSRAWEHLCDTAPATGTFHAVQIVFAFLSGEGFASTTARDYASRFVRGWIAEPESGLVKITTHLHRFFTHEDESPAET